MVSGEQSSGEFDSWIDQVDFHHMRQADLDYVHSLCSGMLLNEDCEYCITAELNALSICGWCIPTSTCMSVWNASNCQWPDAARLDGGFQQIIPADPKDVSFLPPGIGTDFCPRKNSSQWGSLGCVAKTNQKCQVCLNDAACIWCKNPTFTVISVFPWLPNITSAICMSAASAAVYCAPKDSITSLGGCNATNSRRVVLFPISGGTDYMWHMVLAVMLPMCFVLLVLCTIRLLAGCRSKTI